MLGQAAVFMSTDWGLTEMIGDTASKWKRAALWSLPLVLILACSIPVHGSSIAQGAYSIIENAGSALTQRSILDFTWAGFPAPTTARTFGRSARSRAALERSAG